MLSPIYLNARGLNDHTRLNIDVPENGIRNYIEHRRQLWKTQKTIFMPVERTIQIVHLLKHQAERALHLVERELSTESKIHVPKKKKLYFFYLVDKK